MRRQIVGLAATLICFLSANAGAVVIFVAPSLQTVSLGDQASIDIIISDLGAFSAPSLGAFDIEVGYDPSLVSPSSVTFGNGLDLLGLGSIQSTGPGFLLQLNVLELSLDAASDLDTLQPGEFTLFSIVFDTLAAGITPVELSLNALSDSTGLPLQADLTFGRIIIEGAAPTVPEPSALLLMAAALLGAAGLRRTI